MIVVVTGVLVGLWLGDIATLIDGPANTPSDTASYIVVAVIAPVARAVARVDEIAARSLLGPSRAQQLAMRVDTLARSRAELVAAADAERRRIERDLHDGAQQQLVSLAMNLGMARAAVADMPPDARQIIEQAPSIEAIAYFTVAEALTNVTKHAGATEAEITVERADNRLRVIVSDNGRGGARLGADGSGLRGLSQRAASVDGSLHVRSPAGGPTTITVELPCE
jgi:signal transduction histidine kinase